MKTIRIWDGCKVVCVVTAFPGDNGYSVQGRTGGAGNSAKVDIEMDPWAGLIVDHSANRSPVDFREPEE